MEAGRRSAAGINLVDVCAAVATVGVLAALLAVAVPRWTGNAGQHADVIALQRLLRDTQHAAVGEGHPHCVEAGTWRVLREPCGPGRDGTE